MKKTLILLLAVIVISQFGSVIPVAADGLVQSGDRVTVDVTHQHAQDICYDRKWIACGGTWRSNFEPSIGATVYYCSNNDSSRVVNGVALSSIHSIWVTSKQSGTHSGEYVSDLNCDVETAGTFAVDKITGKDNILQATVEPSGSQMPDTSISWECPDGSIVNADRVSLSQNGIYTAVLLWTDTVTGMNCRTTLNYIDISGPVTLVFQSDGKILFKETVAYGDPLPEIELPVRTGYDFLGFYAGDVMWYDSDAGRDESIRITGSSLEQIVHAVYEARSYNVYYGGDGDFIQVTYGEPYDSIEITYVQKEGLIFEGYYWNGEKVFDSKGRSTGLWRWDSEEDIILEAVYRRIEKPSSGNNGGGNQGNGSNDSNANDNGQNVPAVDDGRRSSDNTDSVSDNSSISENLAGQDGYGGGSGPDGNRYGSGSNSGRNSNNGRSAGDSLTDLNIAEDGGEMRIMPGHYTGSLLNQGSATDQNTDSDEDMTDLSEEVWSLTENLASNASVELQRLKNRTIILKAVKVTGITVGTLGLFYLIGWLFITKFGLARIYSFQADGSKCQIGDALILRGENAFHIKIKDKVAGKGDTGRYQIVFSKSFAQRHHNRNIIIHCLGRNIAEIVRPDINMYIE